MTWNEKKLYCLINWKVINKCLSNGNSQNDWSIQHRKLCRREEKKCLRKGKFVFSTHWGGVGLNCLLLYPYHFRDRYFSPYVMVPRTQLKLKNDKWRLSWIKRLAWEIWQSGWPPLSSFWYLFSLLVSFLHRKKKLYEIWMWFL